MPNSPSPFASSRTPDDAGQDRRSAAGTAASFASALLVAQMAWTLAARPLAAQQLPETVANDQRTPAGSLVDGELRIELEVVEAVWHPRGADGPRVVTPVFAEVGRAPSVPGPLIRAGAGTPVRVTIHNRLDRDVQVRGLGDRPPAPPVNGFPAAFSTDSLVVPAGGSAETRFTPGGDVSSIYFGRVVPEPGATGFSLPMYVPGGTAEEGPLVGALVVDEAPPHPDERIIMITRWGSPDEPTSLDTSWKVTLNGRSWPHTERIEATVGDTVRWRVINASLVDHPMHLHGFYFTVDALGDGQADTLFAAGDRRHVVTELMQEISSMRLRWVPERPGNWLFHCHLIRHMGELQRFQEEREADGGAMDHMAGMAGMIIGITVQPRPGETATDPPPARRIDLWTGSRPGVFGEHPELGFVVQDGAVPAPDSTRVPGSPLILTRGEPTEIMIHNRLDFPLSVHWHGLELRSVYDGVGDWSGMPGMPMPPVPVGDTRRVVIEPVRAGTFFYHTHGEPGHELTQGLYGPFLVLEPGEQWDRERDRVFVLGSRGAELDSPPAVNGRVTPVVERFAPGEPVRLRFAHISADAYKRIRLLREGEVEQWRPWAKDGADLPESRRAPAPATLGLGVGEAADVRWTPRTSGVHVLEVTTEFYPSRGGTRVQRVPFVVGEATAAEIREAVTGTPLETAELAPEERARYTGTYVSGAGDDGSTVLAIWSLPQGLFGSVEGDGGDGGGMFLVPLGDHVFTPGSEEGGLVRT
ncbi:MAG TPA: multicopper oxidase domain-containing protein, partial [Longimicrobiales bacterium]|nr:multicopper oxidase domain-containing protein [Longimicrobiales bacterium]